MNDRDGATFLITRQGVHYRGTAHSPQSKCRHSSWKVGSGSFPWSHLCVGGLPCLRDQRVFLFSPVRGTVVSREGSTLGFQRLSVRLFVRFIEHLT